jgi:aryl-alcohol dehydrogenase-like predicted oxidoreductase
MMKKIQLPHTSLEVSKLCMGTMTFGAQVDEQEAQRMVDGCLDAGINFFDTANVYQQGLSEEIVGKCLGERRSRVVLASKVRGMMGDPPRYSGLSRKAIRAAIEESLRRLQTDYLDIYYLHQPDYDTPVEETLEAMNELHQEGKIRFAGTSNYSAWQICELLWICNSKGFAAPWISQPMYNMLARGIEQEYLPFTTRFGVSCVCYNPLAGGMLTGKQDLSRGPLPGTRFDGNENYQRRYWHAEYFRAVEALKGLAARCGKNLPQLALSWIVHQPAVGSVILGASSLQQLQQNLAAAEGPALEPEVLAECDRVWQALRGPTPVYNR